MGHLDKPSTIPNQLDETHEFSVTHPFHPLTGQTYSILSRRYAWGEARVQFLDPITEQVCSLPIEWTSLATPDPFVEIATEKTLLRATDLQQLAKVLGQIIAEE